MDLRKLLIALIWAISANIALSQVNTFPYTESFEQTFTTGTDVSFITNWTGNTVATSNRIFRGTDARTGSASLNIIPTSSFSGEMLISLDLTGITNPKMEFYAFSKQNGSTSTRPVLLSLATSIDGGSNFLDDVDIGDETTFPNDNTTSYTLYEYELPVAAAGESNVVIKITAARGSGSGSAAELVMDDITIDKQTLALEISSVEAQSSSSVLVTFNQEVDQASVETIGNYSIDNSISVTAASRTAVNEVTLTTSTMPNNSYQLTVNNVEDAATNTPATNLQENFDFAEPLSISNTTVVDKNTVELLFNLDLDEVSAETVTNYSIDNSIGTPSTATLDPSNAKRVTLALAADLADNSYNVTVNNVTDQSTLASASDLIGAFTYLPLAINSITANSETELEVTFNQDVESSSAGTAGNYSLDFSFGSPTSAVVSGSDAAVVTLTFASSLVNNTYTLTVNDVNNASANATASGLSDAVTFSTATLSRQIVINEIYADPSGANQPDPQVLPGGSSDEFIELYNASSKHIDLGDFDLTGGTIGTHVLAPGEFVILTASSNVTDFQGFGDVVAVTSWNSLSNSGEQIILKDNLGNIVDSLTYDLTWYQDDDKSDGGWTLEQINPELICSDANNWLASINVAGGTPGSQNSIFDNTPDTTAPELVSVTSNSNTEIVVLFNEIMDQSSLSNGSFSLSTGIGVSSSSPVTPSLRATTLTLDAAMVSGTTYTLTVSGVTDCAGNAIASGTIDFLFDNVAPVFDRFVVKDPITLDLIFDEPLAESPAETESNFSIDQSIGNPDQATLSTPNTKRVSLSLNDSLAASTDYTLTYQNLTDTLGNTVAQTDQVINYTNSIDTVIVTSAQLLDVYFTEAVQTTAAETIENYEVDNEIGSPKTALQDDDNTKLVHLVFDENFNANRTLTIGFEDIKDTNGAFLQALNTTFVYDTDRPGIDSVVVVDQNTLMVYFDEAVELNSAEAINNYSVDNGIGNPTSATRQSDQRIVELVFTSDFQNEEENTLSIRDVRDLAQNSLSSTRNIDFTYDELAPGLSTLKVLSPTQVLLTFSEGVDQVTAETLTSYSIDNGIGNPITAERSARNIDQVTLTFSSLGNNASNTLSISAAEDLNGNTIASDLTSSFATNEIKIGSIKVLTDTTFQVQLTKALVQSTAETLSSYGLTNGINVASVEQDGSDASLVLVTSNSSFSEEVRYDLSISSLQDTDGNTSNNLSEGFEYDSQLANIELLNENTVKLTFENELEETAAETIANYSISEGIGNPISVVLDNEDMLTLTLIFGDDLMEGTAYKLEISGLKDSFEDDIPFGQHDLAYDITAPDVQSVSSTFTNQITVTFTESINQTSAETLNHYTLDNGIGTPSAATLLTSGNEVLLTFASDLADATNYTLTTERVQDLVGNELSSDNTNFTFAAPIDPDFRDLVINEIYPDPDAASPLPNAEFVEIYNAGSEAIKLQGFTFSDNTSTATLSSFELPAGGFLTLTSSGNADLFSGFGEVMGLSNFPSLANSGETIYLKRRDGNVVDSLQYNLSFYQDADKESGGFTIELINPKAPCFSADNYSASASANQGTPGSQNSVFDDTPDTSSPEVTGLTVISDQQLQISFNESMDVASLVSGTFSLDGGLTVSSVDIEDEFGTSVLINLTAAFEPGTEFTLTTSGVKDCAGNTIADTPSTFFLGAVPTSEEIIITEIMANPSPSQGLPEVEYVEIYNASTKILGLEGLKFSDRSSTTTLPDATFKPGEYVLLVATSNVNEFSGIQIEGVSSFPSLNTSGDSLAIADASDNLIFQTVYDADSYQDDTKAAGGYSLEMINPEAPCYDAANWIASDNSNGGTPGVQNSVFDDTPDTTAPEVTGLTVISDQQLQISFNESMDVASIVSDAFSLDGGLTVSSVDIEDEFGTSVLINLTAAFESGTEFTLTTSGVKDCAGNTAAATDNTFFLGAVPTPEEIIITEIMANPSPSQGLPEVEYVEIYNASTKILGLEGLKFSDRSSTTTLPDATFGPGEYVLLVATSNTVEFSGIQIAGVSSFPSLNTSGDSLAIADASDNLIFHTVYDADSYQDDTKAAGGYSLEMINPEAPCYDAANWIAPNNSNGGTPGMQNSVFDVTPDATAPEVTGLTVISDQQLQISFNESMDVASLVSGAFSLDGGLTVSSVEIEDEFGSSVLINLTAAFEPGTEFTLTTSGVKDCAGNSITDTDNSFFLGAVPTPEEIIITEIMANPSPSRGLPEVEYVEIYNASTKILGLEGLKFSDRSSTTTLPDATFGPGEYVLLVATSNTDEFSGIQIAGVSSFPSLNTSGDSLAIADASDNLIFQTVYDSDSYQDDNKAAGGYSLEMINPEALCYDAANWIASDNSNGGTPGVQNSVFDDTPDTTAPEVTSLTVISDQQLQISFNESMDVASLVSGAFSLDGGLTVSSVEIEDEFGTSVLINLTAAFERGTEFTLTTSGVKDCAGNTIADTPSTFFLGAVPTSEEIIITEIMANPSPSQGLPEVEFVEIYNASTKILGLEGLKFSDRSSTTTLPDATFGPGEYVLLVATSNTDEFSGIQIAGVSSFPSLNTSGDSLAIADASDNLIFQTVYDADSYQDDNKAAGGYSLEMINPEAPCYDASNWIASNNAQGGTPGVQNSVFDDTPDTTAPEVTGLTVISDQQLQISFNESMDVASLVSGAFSLDGGLTVSSIDVEDDFGTSVLINLTAAFERGTEFTLTTSGVKDCAGNTIADTPSTFFLGAIPTSEEIIITEIMANPSPSQGLPEVEYVEIYNASTKILGLEGLKFSDRSSTTTLPDATFGPGEYVLLVATSNVDEFSGIQIAGVSSFLSLNTSGDSLAIADASDNLIFQTVYDADSYQDDTKAAGGYSLEMINPEASCYDAANWIASDNSNGGTPGVQNSVFDDTPDTIVPEVTSLSVISDQQLQISFNESMDVASLVSGAFSLDGGLTVSSIDIEDEFGTSVLINLAAAFERGTEFTLTTSGVKDCAGNVIADTPSTFFLGAVPTSEEIIITEIMANPSPSQGLPEVEYVEIYNASTKILGLEGLKFSDRSNTTTLPDATVKPGEYVLLVATSNVDEFSGIQVAGVSSFPSLNTSGDSLAIADASDNLIFQTVYDADSYQDDTKAAGGYSLEMINPEAPCYDAANWIASDNNSGGTPGVQNSVYDNTPDTTAPEVTGLTVISDQQLQISFNESMDVASIVSDAFSLDGGLTVSSVDIEDEFGTSVLINLTTTFERGTEFTLTTSGVKDCTGNAITDTPSTFFLGAVPTSEEIIITEIMANPSPSQGLPEVEYVEIYNASTKILGLEGLKFSDRSSTTTLPDATFKPGEYVLLVATSNTDEFSGIQIAGVTSFPSLNTSGDSLAIADARDNLIFQTVYDADSYQDDTKAAGGYSLEMINPQAPCYDAANWIASDNGNGGTPGVQNSVFDDTPDTTAPEVTGLTVIFDQQLRISFNESMDVASLVSGAFSLDGGLTVSSVEIEDEFGTSVLINLTAAFERGTEFTLTTSGVKDCAGNTIADTPSTFFLGAIPTSEEIIITEIMANPSPSQGLPEVEFVEIYNASTKILGLEGLKFSDRSSTTTLPDATFGPGEYVLLVATSNTDEFSGIQIAGVSSFPSLNTSGDSLAIADASDNLIFQTVYDSDSYQDDTKAAGGYSLEMINPEAPCYDAANWIASDNSNGGTPGVQNSVFDDTPDTTAPQATMLQILNDQQIEVRFNESLDIATIQSTDFQFSNSLEVSTVELMQEFGRLLVLNLNDDIPRGLSFELTITGITDCAGNEMERKVQSFVLGATPAPGDLIITEIMANPSPSQGLPEVEYIEVLNLSDIVINPQGLSLSDRSTSTTLPSLNIAPGAYGVFTSSNGALQLPGAAGVTGFPSLNTSGDLIAISNGSTVIDMVVYESSWYRESEKAQGGYSLEMIDTNYPCLEATNWRGSDSTDGGTPGQVNSVDAPNPDIVGPSLIQAVALNELQVMLTYDEKLESGTLTNNSFAISGGITVNNFLVDETERKITLTLNESLIANTLYSVTTDNITDCSGNLILNDFISLDIVIALEAEAGDVLVNEILFNPRSGGVRFVEVYNNSTKFANLKNWVLAGASNERVITEEELVLSPGAYLVLTTDVDILASEYPGTVNENVFVMNSLPSFANAGGTVALFNSADTELDRFDYDADFHSPLLDNVDGVSLERIRFSATTNDPNNWQSASSTVGFATPGYVNSQSQATPDPGVTAMTVEIEPRSFAPDVAGMASFTTINFEFDNPGNVLNVKIFDANGQLIKQLAQNALVGTEGFFRWDGTTEQGSKARVGYYLILFEIIGPNGEVNMRKERVAIGSRL